MNIAEDLIGIIAPAVCVGCGEEGTCLCSDCSESIDAMPNACYKCGALSPTGICLKCRKNTRLSGAYSACLYSGLAASLVRQLKYQHTRTASKDMARFIDERLPDFGDCLITSLPTANARIRQRGFDHASHLGRQLAELRGLKYYDLLARIGSKRQVGSSKAERLTQIKDKIRVKNSAEVQGKYVVVVDDVITTGGSVDEAARVLKLAGASKVIAICFAHKKLE